ncbi:transcriptional regulator with XRE-family HTH domain [Allocatelliglobosispora scoriae]|uniref:Transcriptional regulator with XRE-family HTH domain n=1 Tax=Allocatelliglobosispora scoriae TaxID=643052 RepID=A0A841BHS5_9ACTN|nr:tetratricopeptide repeat protein [Allocatelliglobosispora scoriae]MBB5867175.1 transcriptional regulator with XRE-family HTH domain [Allocatelliglobosispora scoriae]
MSQVSQPGVNEFARRLRALRTARGITQRDLAGDDLSVSYVSLLESGRRNPTADVVRLLATRLGCQPDELLGTIDGGDTRPPELSVRFGELALEAGRGDAARTHFETALAIAHLSPILRTAATIGLARALEADGRLEEAAKAYEALVQEAVRTTGLTASLGIMVSWCRCLRELGELERVVEIGSGTMQQLDRLNAWESEAAIQLLVTIASAHVELGDYSQAERLLQEGLQRAERMRSPRARASVLWNASEVASERGKHWQALELAEEALSYFRHGSDQRSALRLLAAYGYLLLHQDPPRPAEAREALEEALSGLTIGFDRGYVLTELSRAHLLEGDLDLAADTARESLRELGAEPALERARAQTALGAALAAKGDRKSAKVIFAEAADALTGLKATRQAARVWAELGDLLAEFGDHRGAVTALRQATAALHIGPKPKP